MLHSIRGRPSIVAVLAAGAAAALTVLLIIGPGIPASAATDVDIDDTVGVGETTTVTVHTEQPGRTVVATITSGDAVFLDDDGEPVTEIRVESNEIGYGETGTAQLLLFIPEDADPGEVDITFTDTTSEETLTASILIEDNGPDDDVTTPPGPTLPVDDAVDDDDVVDDDVVDEDEGTGDFTDPPGPEAGVHIAVWGGGTLEQLLEAVPEGTLSIWATRDGDFIGYVIDAPSFVNADFTAAHEGTIPPGTPLIIVRS